MKLRKGKIGSSRVVRKLDASGVAQGAIPRLESGYRVSGISELGLIGAAPKDFVVFERRGTPSHPYAEAYVAKKPVRQHTGFRECVTEYLIARIGRMLPLRVATGRLVRIDRGGKAPDVRFMSRYFLQPDESLLHGVELVAQCFGMERGAVEKEVRTTEEERSLYTVDFVDAVLRDFGREPAVYRSLRDGFTRMIAFDALVGAVDRHASNWGVIEHLPRVRPPRFAPVFDTARGLLLRYSDDELREQTATPAAAQAFIETFARRAHPLVGVPGVRNVSYFDLIAHMVSRGEELEKPVRSIVYAFCPRRVRAMMHREFHSLLHPVRLRLIYELLRYRHGRLMDICQRPKHTS
jgi:hypothetical protein